MQQNLQSPAKSDSSPVLYIGADFIPTSTNVQLFKQGAAEELVGSDLMSMLSKSNLNIFNLEAPLTNNVNKIQKSGPHLIAPLESINTYFKFQPLLLSLANNHILDQNESGVYDTLRILDLARIPNLGAGINLSTAKMPKTIRLGNKVIGFYSCAEHECTIAGFNSAGANPFNPLESYDDVAKLKQYCHHVIVLYHGGAEEYRYPSPDLQKYCRKFIEKGASLVVCQHSHCIGCREDYLNGIIIYGQGNFLFNKYDDNEYFDNGLLLKVIADDYLSVEEIPVEKHGNGIRLAEGESKKKILDGYKSRSTQIKIPGFLENNYRKFAVERIPFYMRYFYLDHMEMFINGLPKHNWIDILNNTRCENHREIFYTILKLLGNFELNK